MGFQKRRSKLTTINSSSPPLNKNIIGCIGTQPESTISLATSSIDAAKQHITIENITKSEHFMHVKKNPVSFSALIYNLCHKPLDI